MKRAAVTAVTLVTALALSGCVSDADDRTVPSSSGSPSATSANAVNPTPPVDDATPAPVPEAATDSQAAGITAAEGALTAYARPGLGYQEWIDGLYPHLTQAGAAAYEDTDPALIPVSQVTGAGTILPASTEVALIVQIPTDAGLYNVSVSRTGTDAPWLADRIRPAAG